MTTTPPEMGVGVTTGVVERYRAAVDAALEAALPAEASWPTTIHQAMRYSLFAGGKRIRPALVLAAGEAVGCRAEPLTPFACAVEMIHTYSLIHDDLPAMDDDDLRRGKPTCHKVFGEAVAILAGDALLTRAFELLSASTGIEEPDAMRRRLQATSVLAAACGTTGLIGGQVEDLESEGRDVDAASLERIHRAKTGALLRACAVGGGILGGADEPQRERLDRYGRGLGLAFQVVDDILDATEAPERLGKTAGKDAAAGKATYVRVHGLETARRMARDLLEGALAAVEPFGPAAASLRELAHLVVDRRE